MFRKSKFDISKKFPCYIQFRFVRLDVNLKGFVPCFYVYALLPKWTHLIPVLSDAAQCARLQATGAELESGSLLSTAFTCLLFFAIWGKARAWRNPALYLSYHHGRARVALGTDYCNTARLHVPDRFMVILNAASLPHPPTSSAYIFKFGNPTSSHWIR